MDRKRTEWGSLTDSEQRQSTSPGYQAEDDSIPGPLVTQSQILYPPANHWRQIRGRNKCGQKDTIMVEKSKTQDRFELW